VPQPHHVQRPPSGLLVWVYRTWDKVSNLVLVPGITLHVHPVRLVRRWSSFNPSVIDVSDTSQDPESLLKFFIILATASETDLGFDTNIKRVGESNFDLEFTVRGRTYHTSKLLCDIGANVMTGQGTWVFKVNDQETEEVRVIKDCWLEDRPGGQMEHEVVAEIKTIMGDKEFRKNFIDIDGHRKTYESGRLNSVCEILENRTSENSEPDFVVHVPCAPQSSYHHRFQPDPVEWVSNDLPHPRFRYQVVYNEAGISLFQVTSFADAIKHIGQAADGV